MDIDLNPDGPHSPERTAEVAAIFDACSRFLVYATMGTAPGLDYPSEAYRLLGELYSATGRMQQLFGHLRVFLRAQAGAGKLGDRSGRDIDLSVSAACGALVEAGNHSAALTSLLQEAQNEIAGLHGKSGTEGSDGND